MQQNKKQTKRRMNDAEPLDNMEVVEISTKLWCNWMKGLGKFARMGVQGDGSCFFHSVCALQNKENYLFASPKLQQKIAYKFRCSFTEQFTSEEYNHIKSESSFSKDFETTKTDFCSPEAWADEVMIRHASSVLNLNLIFLDVNNEIAYCGVHGDEAGRNLIDNKPVLQKTAIVAWVNHSHFEPIVKIDDADKGLITTIFDPLESKEDSKVVEAIMSNYKKECKI